MESSKKTLAFIALSALIMVSAISLFYGAYASAGENAASKGAVEQVSPNYVCMVNDTVMGKPQIPVEVEGKTYYGCCMGCVTRLKGDRTARYALDPVTGKEVDKARAYIISAPDGAALYFESADSAKRFMAGTGKN